MNNNNNTTIALKNRMKMPFQPSLFAFTAIRLWMPHVFSMGNACCARLSTIPRRRKPRHILHTQQRAVLDYVVYLGYEAGLNM